MSDMIEDFKFLKQMNKERKQRNLSAADPTGWTKHTEHHWSRLVAGKKLNYWPSRNKFQYDGGRVMVGDVVGFIRNQEKKNAG